MNEYLICSNSIALEELTDMWWTGTHDVRALKLFAMVGTLADDSRYCFAIISPAERASLTRGIPVIERVREIVEYVQAAERKVELPTLWRKEQYLPSDGPAMEIAVLEDNHQLTVAAPEQAETVDQDCLSPSTEAPPANQHSVDTTSKHPARGLERDGEDDSDMIQSLKSESHPSSFDEPAADVSPASPPTATTVPATPLAPATPAGDVTLLDTTTALASPSAVPVTRSSTYSDGGFLQAVQKAVSYAVSVGVYVYAMWIVAWSAVWIGSLSSFRGLTATFPGFTLELPVPLYEGIAKGSVTGRLTLPSLSLPLFPTDINHAIGGT